MFRKLLEFLFSLDRVTFTRHTRFEFAVPWRNWIFPACILLALIAWWSYRRQSTTRNRRLWLSLVRALLLIAVFLLFSRPQLVLDYEERTRSVVAVWLDPSASMSLEDPYAEPAMRNLLQKQTAATTLPAGQTRLNRYQLALGSLTNAKWLNDLTETQDVIFFSGSAHAQTVGTAHSPAEIASHLATLQAIKPEGETTDIPTVLQEIIQSAQGTRLSAIIVLTDGQTTETGAAGGGGGGSRIDQAVAVAQHAGAKIFALPLGESAEPFNLKLSNFQVPPNTFVRDPVAVKIHLSATGIDRPTPVKVTLYRVNEATTQNRTPGVSAGPLGASQGLTPLATKDFTLDPAKKELDAELIFKPQTKSNPDNPADDRFDLLAKVEAITAAGAAPAEELTLKDNEKTAYTVIHDAQINVLLIDSAPRWEFRYLKNELIRERTVNVSALLISADPDFPQEGDPRIVDKEGREIFPGPITRFPETAEELAKYHVLLIGDVEASYFSPTQQKLILDFVRQSGGGIGWIAGPNYNPESYKGTPLEPLLPITPDEIDPRARVMAPAVNEPFNLVLTAAGKESNLFRFFDDPETNARQMTELPEMFWYKPIQGLKPAAEVLAVHPTRTQGGMPAPLIVAGRYGKGRTLFSAVADTWRWRRYTGEPLFQSYWLQMCRLLYEGQLGQDNRIELAAESTRVEVRHPIKLTLSIKDPSLLPQIPAKLQVAIADKAGRPLGSIQLQRAPNATEDQLEGMTTANQVGPITLTVEPGILPIEPKPLALTIEPPQREFESLTANIPDLTTLAVNTTGQVIPLYRAEDLARLVPDRSLPTLNSLPEELWYKPLALLLILTLATTEWLLRKRAGLI